jgi:hypothetical protein
MHPGQKRHAGMLHHTDLQSKKTSGRAAPQRQEVDCMVSNQRDHQRYMPCHNAFISLGSAFTRVGSIRDISLSGAAFEYLDYTESKPFSGESVDIFICGTYMHIANMPCRVVYEQPSPEQPDDELPAGTMVRKRCGIEFRPATAQHRAQLEAFLLQYMQDRAADQD